MDPFQNAYHPNTQDQIVRAPSLPAAEVKSTTLDKKEVITALFNKKVGAQVGNNVPPLKNITYDKASSSSSSREFSLLTASFQERELSSLQEQINLFKTACEEKNASFAMSLQENLDPNLSNAEGKSLLHLAIDAESDELVSRLLERGAAVDNVDDKGQTPLHLAADKGDTYSLNILLDAGAKQSIVDKAGCLPMQRAELSGKNDAVQLLNLRDPLCQKLAKVTYSSPLSFSPLVPQNGINNPRSELNKANFERFTHAHNPEFRAAVGSMVENTDYVSYEDFNKMFMASLKSLNSSLKPEEAYVVVIEPNKSNKWMAELAIRHLDVLPTDFVTTKGINEALEKNPDIKRIVFFDDASYSGEQICRFVQEKGIASFAASEVQDFRIDVVIPFMTEVAAKKLAALDTGNGEIVVSPHKMMRSMAEQIPEEHHTVIDQLYFPRTHAATQDLDDMWQLLFTEEDDDDSFEEKYKHLFKAKSEEALTYSSFEQLNDLKNLRATIKEKLNKLPDLEDTSDVKKRFFLANNSDILSATGKLKQDLQTWWSENETTLRQDSESFPDNEELEEFVELLEGIMDAPAQREVAFKHDKGMLTRTLTVFDHKIADQLSTCPAYQTGTVFSDGGTMFTSGAAISFNLFPGKPRYKSADIIDN